MKKRTAKTVDQVRTWIETNAHHIVEHIGGEAWANPPIPPTHTVLRGYHEQLRVPTEIWLKCYVRPGEIYDTRFFRWDSFLERQDAWAKK